ncbi:hypothetical protein ACOSQ2_002710 [Xanthoceras sorbifolium]
MASRQGCDKVTLDSQQPSGENKNSMQRDICIEQFVFSVVSNVDVDTSVSNSSHMNLDQKHSRWKRLARLGSTSVIDMDPQRILGKRSNESDLLGVQIGGDSKRAWFEDASTLRKLGLSLISVVGS